MLTSSERKALKARAHKLDPVVIIGAKGLTDEVIAEIDRALRVHELIKVRAPGTDRKQLPEILQQICENTTAEPVQQVGKVLVIYRRNSAQS